MEGDELDQWLSGDEFWPDYYQTYRQSMPVSRLESWHQGKTEDILDEQVETRTGPTSSIPSNYRFEDEYQDGSSITVTVGPPIGSHVRDDDAFRTFRTIRLITRKWLLVRLGGYKIDDVYMFFEFLRNESNESNESHEWTDLRCFADIHDVLRKIFNKEMFILNREKTVGLYE